MNDPITANAPRYEIIVNLRPRSWTQDQISFEQVVHLAFPNLPPDPNRVFTVGYKIGHRSGTLVAGQSVDVQSGMNFDVDYSTRS